MGRVSIGDHSINHPITVALVVHLHENTPQGAIIATDGRRLVDEIDLGDLSPSAFADVQMLQDLMGQEGDLIVITPPPENAKEIADRFMRPVVTLDMASYNASIMQIGLYGVQVFLKRPITGKVQGMIEAQRFLPQE